MRRPYVALTALCVGFFLLMMDITIVNVAIPTIRRELPATLNDVVWVNSVYLLAYAVPLLLAGRLGDWWGRKPMFLSGMALFTAASLLCGLAGSAPELIAARGLQGLGAAAMAPQTMAFIAALFPEDRRGTPMGIWGGTGAAAAALAPLLAGGLIAAGGWRWIFFVNVPIGAAGLLLGLRVLPGGRTPRGGRVDVLGAVLSGLGLLALVFFLQNGQVYHWGRVVGPVYELEIAAAGAALLAAFVWWQRVARADPLMPLELFQRRTFSLANLLVVAIGFAWSGMFLPLTLYLQTGLGLSPMRAGLLMMPQAIAAGLVGPLAGRLADRFDARAVIVGSTAVFGAGIAVIALSAGVHGSNWPVIAGATLCGVGTGAVFPPLAAVAMRGLPGPLMGSASGVYSTARQVGVVLGSAAVGVLLQAQVAAHPSLPTAVRLTLLLPVAVLAAAAALGLALPSVSRAPSPRELEVSRK